MHFSYKKIIEIENKTQSNAPAPKPNGFWVSCENSDLGWKEWCETNDFDGNWDYSYKVYLTQHANILLLENSQQIKDFSEKYSAGDWIVDWKEVAKIYDGIIIAPYQWSCRLNVSWYYTWDCASGCIWNAKAIKTFLLFNADLKKYC